MNLTIVLIPACWVAATAPGVESPLARVDEAWMARGSVAEIREAERRLDEAAALHANDPDVLWRKARLLIWKGEQTKDSGTKAALGMAAYKAASRAADLAPRAAYGRVGTSRSCSSAKTRRSVHANCCRKSSRHLSEAIPLKTNTSRTGRKRRSRRSRRTEP